MSLLTTLPRSGVDRGAGARHCPAILMAQDVDVGADAEAPFCGAELAALLSDVEATVRVRSRQGFYGQPDEHRKLQADQALSQLTPFGPRILARSRESRRPNLRTTPCEHANSKLWADLSAEVAGADAKMALVHLGDGIYVKAGLEKGKATRLVLTAGLRAFAPRAIQIGWSFATVWV